jgi:uncharacterized protein (DUF2141 family)
MIAGVVSFIRSFASRQPKRRLLFTIATLLVGTAAHAQEEAVGRQFLPLPDGIPAMLFDGLSEPEDPTEIAHQVRRSISDPAATSASTDSRFDRTIEPAALTAPDFSTAALPGEIEDSAVPALAPTSAVISVIVENVETSGGTVNIGLCDKGLSRETCPYDKSVRASEGFVEATFENIPPGSYAVVAYHDVNGNGQFDRLLGIPREPYALSGQAAKKMVPTFGDAVLPMRTGENAVVIRLKRLGGG